MEVLLNNGIEAWTYHGKKVKEAKIIHNWLVANRFVRVVGKCPRTKPMVKKIVEIIPKKRDIRTKSKVNWLN